MDKFLVLGGGKSGIAAANLLIEKQIPVVIYDGNPNLDEEALKKKLNGDVEFIKGEFPAEKLGEFSRAVISPGISPEKDFVVALANAGCKILSEIELGYLFEKGLVLGITGTNGKTTTTTLVGEIMKAHLGKENALAVGNIGVPYADWAAKTGPNTASVIELSSFQLETIDTFRPQIAAVLNITEDHLDRHHTMERYAQCKMRITENQTPSDVLILNFEDEYLRTYGESLKDRTLVWISGRRTLERGWYLRDGYFCKNTEGSEERLLKTSEINLVGQCNFENVLFAMAMADAAHVPMETIIAVVKEFRAVPHRIEFVREVNGVRYYNDSKGTNPDAAIQGIRAMDRPTIVIGGGYDKHSDFIPWIKEFGDKVKCLILLGQTKAQIRATAEALGFTKILDVESLEEAVEKAYELATSGDAVLLSPACASWGMFKNYEERGDIFKALVSELKEK